jgi:hypothetical protein
MQDDKAMDQREEAGRRKMVPDDRCWGEESGPDACDDEPDEFIDMDSGEILAAALLITRTPPPDYLTESATRRAILRAVEKAADFAGEYFLTRTLDMNDEFYDGDDDEDA